MDRAITVLAGLVVGLRGARRRAFIEVLEWLREETGSAEEEGGRLRERIGSLETERDAALKGMVEERDRADALQRRMDALPLSALEERDGGLWRLSVRRGFLDSHKVFAVKALMVAAHMGLREAKEWVEARTLGPGFRTGTLASPTDVPKSDDWVALSEGMSEADLVPALDILLNRAQAMPRAKPPTSDDVLFRPLGPR